MIISVRGTGLVEAIPDIALLRIQIQSKHMFAKTALITNNEKVEAVIAVIDKLNIEKKTCGFTIAPEYEADSQAYGRPQTTKICQFVVTHSLLLTINDINKLGEAISALAFEGVFVDHPNLIVSNFKELKDKARQKAVTDACNKAMVYCNAMGKKLSYQVESLIDTITELAEYGNYEGNCSMALGSSVPIQVGDQTISCTIDVNFRM